MKLFATSCIACLWLACGPLFAQEARNEPRHDPIAEHVLPPELIMQHQKAIGLSDAQKTAVIAEIKRAQGRMVDVQWDMQRAMERLVELLKQDKVDEQGVIAQLDNVLAVEREVKRAQLGLAVRLKNILNPDQQRMLRELRAGQARPNDAATRR
jgi:Spy/CpxP family protein refolding chaperone